MGAQGKDDVVLTPGADVDYAAGSPPSSNKHKWGHLGAIIFLLLNVIVLYILHFVDNGSSTATAVTGNFKSKDLSATSVDGKKGLAVSYGADGKLRVGAGTTAYLDAATMPTDKISYMQFGPLGTSKPTYDTNIIAYMQGASPNLKTVVTTIKGDATAKSVTLGDATDANTLKNMKAMGVATLSDTSAVVLTTQASADGMTITPFITPLTISGESVEVNQKKQIQATNSSATNFITALSDKTFAHVYYEPYSMTETYYERVQVGTVAADGAITFSTSAKFGAGNTATAYTTTGQPHKVLKAGARFAVPWFVDTSSAMATGNKTSTTPNPGLCVSTFSYESGAVTADKDLCDPKYQPAYYVDSTKLSDNVLALAFIDTANKNSLTIVTVEYSEITFQPKLRGATIIDEASGAFDFGASMGFYPKPNVQVLGDNRVAIGFMNPSNTGKPSIKVFKYSSDLALSAASPVLPIANADFTLATAESKASGAIVLSMVPLTSGFVVGFGGSWANNKYQRLSFVESFGDPVGVITDSGSDLSVAMAGTTKVDASLEAGRAYYAATSGKLYTPSSITSDKYVLVNEDKIVVSRSSLVGVAVSGSKLFVSAQAN